MLGSNNTQNNQNFEPTYYSRMSWKNDEDKLKLSPNYWKGCLKLSVSELKFGEGTRPEELAYIHLSPMKAKILSIYVRECIDNPDSGLIKAINTGASDTQGLLSISRDENGRPYIIMAKIDKDGNYLQSQRFNFNHHYNYGLNITDATNLSFTKEYYDNSELEQFYELLVDYSRSINGAIGASTWDIGRYEFGKNVSKPINMIMDKLGIDRKGNRSGGSGTSYFSNSGDQQQSNSGLNSSTKPVSTGSITDLDSEFDD